MGYTPPVTLGFTKKNMTVNKKKQTCIVVIGMHRSGTSLITKGIELLGVNLGDNLLQGRSDNPKGYWEDERIIALNDKILSFLGLNLFSTKQIYAFDISIIPDTYYKEAITIIDSLRNVNIFGFKDPRTARLILFWKKVLLLCKVEARYIIVIRNPLSIASSLEKRDGLHPIYSQVLWLLHILPPIYHTNENNRILIDYDNFIDNPLFYLQKISEKTLLKKTNENKYEIEYYCNSFIDLNLRHNLHSYNNLESSKQVLYLVKKTYKALLHTSLEDINHNQELLKTTTEELYNDLLLLSPLFELINHQENEKNKILCKIQNKKNDIDLLLDNKIIRLILFFGFLPGLKKLKRLILQTSKNIISS